MSLDIRPDHLQMVQSILKKHLPQYEVWVFGSRARWTAKDHSDLDLCVVSDKPLSFSVLGAMAEDFSDSDLPWKVDVVDWATTSESFRKVIMADKVVVQEGKIKKVSMAGERLAFRLGKVCSKIGSGATPRGGQEAYKGGATALIRSQNIYNDGFHHDGLVYIDDNQSFELQNVEVQPNDVLLNITGDSVARCCQVATDILPARVNQHVAIIRPMPSVLDARFLRYVLISHDFQARMLALASAGATPPALTKAMIESLDIPLPPLPEQKAISHILGTLDDKIELNRRMNATLEAMARALFQSWFVDFDPVRRNADRIDDPGLTRRRGERGGKASQNLPPLRASAPPREPNDALFPAHFQESALGPIPEGWRTSSLGELAKNVSATFDFTKTSEVTFINTGDVLEGDFLHSKRVVQLGLPGQAKKSIQPDDILFSEIRPANKRFAYVDFNSSDYVVSTKFMVIRASKEIQPRLLYRILTSSENLNEFQVQAESRSGTFPQITFDSICHLSIVLPPMEIQEAYQRTVWDIDAQIKLNKHQSRTLAALRDTLLPKLLSGELSVANAEVHAETRSARRKKP